MKRLTLKYVKTETLKLAPMYICKAEKYINNYTKMLFICDKRHEFCMTWNDFQRGARCPKCSIKERGLRRRGENHPLWKGGVKKKDIPLYNTYAHQIDWAEEIRRDPENKEYLQVKCTNSVCRKWFTPNGKDVILRVRAINGKIGNREGRFYCSDKCKQECPIFRQQMYPKGFKADIGRDLNLQMSEMLGNKCTTNCTSF